MQQKRFTIVKSGGFCIDYDPYYPVNNTSTKEVLCDYYEFEFYFEDWEGGLWVDRVLYPVRQGYFTCSKPGQRIQMKRPYRCYFFNLLIHDPALKQALDQLPVYASHPKMDEIITLCEKMFQAKERTTLTAQLQLDGLVSMILSLLLLQQYSVPNATEPSVLRHQDALLKANEYIRAHICEDIDLEELAKISHLHPTYFHKLFKAAYAQTPTQRLLRHRIFAAQDMLQDGELPLSEISKRCGFSSQNYFSYQFKKELGMTPTQYRNKFKKSRK